MKARMIAGIIATVMFFAAMIIELFTPFQGANSNLSSISLDRITAFILGGIGLIALWISILAKR